MFVFDVFWVFGSTAVGFQESVMVRVATAAGAQGGLPMLIRYPTVSDDLPHDGILGLGDIAIPGFLLSYCMRLDWHRDKVLAE